MHPAPPGAIDGDVSSCRQLLPATGFGESGDNVVIALDVRLARFMEDF